MSKLRITFKASQLTKLMDTGYEDFESSAGIDGLAKIRNGTLSLLAVKATKQRTGQFRKFITQAKRKFKRIEIMEVWNLGLRDVLKRYGFTSDGSGSFQWTVDTTIITR